MSFVPEDGTGLPNSNSYVTVAEADAYFSLRGVTQWGPLTEQKKHASLVLATEYIDSVFGQRFIGNKFSSEQSLQWPRLVQCSDATPYYPEELKRACFEYAFIAKDGSLFPSIEYDETGRLPTLKREKLAVLEEETRWTVPNGQMQPTLIKPYPSADIWIQKLCRKRIGGGKTLR